MPIAHDDNATGWRDLADQLTPQQIAQPEYCERNNVPPGLATPQNHLNAARMMIHDNLIQAVCADIAPPPDAAGDIYPWEQWDDGYARMYCATTRTAGALTAEIMGFQHEDGRIERHIPVSSDPSFELEQLDAATARQLAALLIDAADELDRLN